MKITPLFLFLGLFIIFLIPILFRNISSYFSFKSIFEGMNTFESTKNTGDFVHIPLYSGSSDTGTVIKIYDTIFFDTKNGNLIECEESATEPVVPPSTGTAETGVTDAGVTGATGTDSSANASAGVTGATGTNGANTDATGTVGPTGTASTTPSTPATTPTTGASAGATTPPSATGASATPPTTGANAGATTPPPATTGSSSATIGSTTGTSPSAGATGTSVSTFVGSRFGVENFAPFEGFKPNTWNYNQVATTNNGQSNSRNPHNRHSRNGHSHNGHSRNGPVGIEGFSGFKRREGFSLREGLENNDPVQKIYGMTRDGAPFEYSKTASMDTSGVTQFKINTLSNAFNQHIYTTKGATSSDSVLNNKYIVVYVSWGQSTYLHVLVPDSAVIKLSAFYNVATKQVEKIVYPRSGEPNTITLETRTPTGTDADNNKFIENLVPAYGHPLYQVSPSVFYDKFNGQLVVSSLNSENINANVINYPRTNNAVYDRSGKLVNTDRWSTSKALPETTGFDSWVRSDMTGGVVIYSSFGNFTLITNVKKTSQNQFIIGNIVRFDNNGTVISSSSSSAAASEAQYNVIPPDDADDVYGGEYKKWLAYWHALMGATSSDDYLLKSQIVFPQNPYYNVRNESCGNCKGCAKCDGTSKVDDNGIVLKDSSGNTVSSLFADAKEVSKSAVADAGRTAKQAAKGTAGLARDAAKGTVGLARDTAKGTVGLAKDTVTGTVGLARDTATGTVGLAKDTVTGTVGLAKDTVSGTIGLAKDTVSGTAGFVKDAVSGTAGFVKDVAYDTVSGGVGITKDIAGGLLSTKNRSASGYYDNTTPYGGPSYGSKPANSSRAPIDYLSNYGRMTAKGGDFIPITASFAAFGK